MKQKLILAAVFVFGFALLGMAWMLLSEGVASYSWPQVEGTVVSHRVVRDYEQAARQQENFHAEVYYRYSVNGRSYSGKRYAIDRGPNATGAYSSSDEARAVVAQKYPRGEPVVIYYDPESPDQAVLKTGASFWSAFPGLMGLLVIFAGFWLMRQGQGHKHG
jgi:hypothetical protein